MPLMESRRILAINQLTPLPTPNPHLPSLTPPTKHPLPNTYHIILEISRDSLRIWGGGQVLVISHRANSFAVAYKQLWTGMGSDRGPSKYNELHKQEHSRYRKNDAVRERNGIVWQASLFGS